MAVGIPALETSAASCSGPDGRRCDRPAVSRIASSQELDQLGMKRLRRNVPDARPLHCASFFPSRIARSFPEPRDTSWPVRRHPDRAGQEWPRNGQRTAVTISRKSLDAANGAYRVGMPLCDGANFQRQFAAAARASRRAVMGVEAGVRLLAVNVIVCRSTPLVPSTAPSGRPIPSSTGPCSMCQLKIGCRVLPLPSGVADGIQWRRHNSASASSSRLPPASVRPRSWSMVCVPAKADDPEKAAPKARTLPHPPIDQPHGHWRFAFVTPRQCGAGRVCLRSRPDSRRAILHWAPNRG